MGRAVVRDEEYWREEFEHRAGILEYEGGLSRKDAEREAGTWLALERLRFTTERAQAVRQPVATRAPKMKQITSECAQQEQATLPGFERAFQGG